MRTTTGRTAWAARSNCQVGNQVVPRPGRPRSVPPRPNPGPGYAHRRLALAGVERPSRWPGLRPGWLGVSGVAASRPGAAGPVAELVAGSRPAGLGAERAIHSRFLETHEYNKFRGED